MTPVIYAVKIDKPIDREIFDYLLSFVRQDKRDRILRQKVKRNADEMLMGEILAMTAIKEVFGVAVSRQNIVNDNSGKPFLLGYPDMHFNISHSAGYVVCAVCDMPVGIDIQKTTAYSQAVAKKFCTSEELMSVPDDDKDSWFTMLWTRKEAALKLRGTGISSGDIKNCLDGVIAESKKTDDYWLTVCTMR